jgi:hypothetical protein
MVVRGKAQRAAELALLLVTAFAAVPGCGAKTDRLPISGKVTLDGAPLDGGTIRFTSIGTAKLMATGASIVAGEFQIPGDKGLPPGTYGLEISAAAPNPPPGALTAPELIPAEYNSNSQHKIEIKADADNYFTFDILSRTR